MATLRQLFDDGRLVPWWRYLAPTEAPADWISEFSSPPSGTFAVTPSGTLWVYPGNNWYRVGDQGSPFGASISNSSLSQMSGHTIKANPSGTFGQPQDVAPTGSLIIDGLGLRFVNDSGTPGTNKVYGTDSGGAKGWKNDPIGGSDSSLPSSSLILVDDFIAGGLTSPNVGELRWSFTNGTVEGSASPDSNHPGHIRRVTGTQNNQVASMWLSTGLGNGRFRFDQFDTMYWVLRLTILAAEYTIRFGIGLNWGENPPTNRVLIERLSTDTGFFGVTANGGIQTRTAQLIAQTTAYITFRIRRISASEVGFQVNGGTEVTLSTNIPAAGVTFNPGLQIIKTSGSGNKSADIDFFSLKFLSQNR